MALKNEQIVSAEFRRCSRELALEEHATTKRIEVTGELTTVVTQPLIIRISDRTRSAVEDHRRSSKASGGKPASSTIVIVDIIAIGRHKDVATKLFVPAKGSLNEQQLLVCSLFKTMLCSVHLTRVRRINTDTECD